MTFSTRLALTVSLHRDIYENKLNFRCLKRMEKCCCWFSRDKHFTAVKWNCCLLRLFILELYTEIWYASVHSFGSRIFMHSISKYDFISFALYDDEDSNDDDDERKFYVFFQRSRVVRVVRIDDDDTTY